MTVFHLIATRAYATCRGVPGPPDLRWPSCTTISASSRLSAAATCTSPDWAPLRRVQRKISADIAAFQLSSMQVAHASYIDSMQAAGTEAGSIAGCSTSTSLSSAVD